MSNLAPHRLRANLTRAAFAPQLSAVVGRTIQPSTLRAYEAGNRPVPLDVVAAYARLLHLSAEEVAAVVLSSLDSE